jgi:hypothetical protein
MEKAAKHKHICFWIVWMILNLLGWANGTYFAYLMVSKTYVIHEYAVKYGFASAYTVVWHSGAALAWFPLGLSIGVMQWVKLRQLRVNFLAWTLLTALGTAVSAAIFDWVRYDLDRTLGTVYATIPGLLLTMPIVGAIGGILQFLAIRNHISKPGLWIKANTLGLITPAIVALVAVFAKSMILKFLYSAELYSIVHLRWYLFYGLLIVITSVCISFLTGKILLTQQVSTLEFGSRIHEQSAIAK